MRTVTINIGGKPRILCFSVRVMRACSERYGTFGGVYKAMASENEAECLDEVLWLLAEMMKAGDRYAKDNALENPEPLSVEALLDCCDLADFAQMRGAVTRTIANGSKTNIEVEPKKNAEATQEP